MLKITFHPEIESREYMEAANSYADIWRKDKKNICRVLEEASGFSFNQAPVHAIVASTRSRSHPLTLKYSLDPAAKKTTLVHELGHRIIADKRGIKKIDPFELHKELYLILFDAWSDIYGESFAKKSVERERQLDNDYVGKAWDFALAMSREQRQKTFREYYPR